MEPPYGTCGRRELKVVNYYPYTVNSCILDCVLQYVIKTCGCVRFDLQYAVGTYIFHNGIYIICGIYAVHLGIMRFMAFILY